MPFILKWEGETYENVQGDPGGPTHYGIDKESHPGVDIRNLTKQGALEIYFQEWGKEQCELLPDGLGEAYFNACVNCGVGRAVKLLNHAPHHTAAEFLTAQEEFYRALVRGHPALGKFLRGWLNRTSDLRKLLQL